MERLGLTGECSSGCRSLRIYGTKRNHWAGTKASSSTVAKAYMLRQRQNSCPIRQAQDGEELSSLVSAETEICRLLEQIRDSYPALQSQQIYTPLSLHQCPSAVKTLLEPSPQLSLAPVISPSPKLSAPIGPHLATRSIPPLKIPPRDWSRRR